MLEKFNLLSVNQLAAKIKLLEVWKMVKTEGGPLQLDNYKPMNSKNKHDLRDQQNRIFNDSCRLLKSEQSFHVDAAKLWNGAPLEIRSSLTISAAKSATTKYCLTLPI